QQRIWTLLDAIKADFPRRKQEAEAYMSQRGPYDPLELEIRPPEKALCLPTFKKGVSRPVTPMLRARFAYAGTWQTGYELWLGPSDLARWLKKREVRSQRQVRREHAEDSAPALFADEQLSLFAVKKRLFEDVIYLVWAYDDGEPELWSYA